MNSSKGSDKENDDRDVSYISKPFNFKNYFSKLSSSSSSAEKLKFNNLRARTNFILGASYKICPRPKRTGKMLATTTTTSKSSTCFICYQQFPFSELSAHEKSCLEIIKTNDMSYTQNDDDSSSGSFPLAYASNLSTHSCSSNEEKNEKKYSRCYICGTDVPSYLSSIHEKNCKKSWETGLLNSICTPARKAKSKADLSTSTPNLSKSKSHSSTNLNVSNTMSPSERRNSESKPRHLKSNHRNNNHNNTKCSSGNDLLKSKSTTNLASKTMTSRSPSSTDIYAAKSSEDLLGGSERKSTKKSDTNPQYVICQTCGKLYSIHSISIHQRSCERTYSKQKEIGTNVEYKVKSKSLADLSMTPKRPSSAMSLVGSTRSKATTTTPSKSTRPASAKPLSSTPKTNSSLSRSTGNLSSKPNYKRQLLSLSKDFNDGTSTPSSLSTFRKSPQSSVDTRTSSGLQKCYLCSQLYGTRSLPIHEKQCLKKWERDQEEEKKKKKKSKKHQEIQILAFGRSPDDEENFDNKGNQKELMSNNRQNDISSPSQLFGIPSPLRKSTTVVMNGDLIQNEEKSAVKIHLTEAEDHTPESGQITRSCNNESDEKGKENKSPRPGSAKSKFVICVYCYKQYGLHSIAIHEKNCRERKVVEDECKERMAKNNNKKTDASKLLSKSVGDISSVNGSIFTNGDVLGLVKCEECQRKFLSTDIDNHKKFCRISNV